MEESRSPSVAARDVALGGDDTLARGKTVLPEWRYLDFKGLAVAVALSQVFAPIYFHFFGLKWTLVWAAIVPLSLLGVHRCAQLYQSGNKRMRGPAVAFNLIHVLLWTGASLALWTTDNKSAWVSGMAIATSVSFYTIFTGQRNLRVTFLLLAPTALVLVFYMVAASWIEAPLWITVFAAICAFGTLAGIAQAALSANRSYVRMKSAIATLNAVQERLQFVIDGVGDGYFEIDFADMIYRPNPKLAVSLGFPVGNKDLGTLQDRVHADDAPEAAGHFQQCLAGKSTGWAQDLRILEAAGGYRWMHLRASVLNDGDKRILIGTVVDLTARKALEEDLRTAKEAAEGSSRAKGEFLANMSHEIRTPLNGVLGMAQSLAADDLPPEQEEKVAIILDSGKALLALLNDVLDLSKIDAGKFEIAPVPGDLLHTMGRIRELFQPQADEKELELVLRHDAGFPEQLAYDPVRVRQCVSNLVANAIKFTERGAIDILVSARPTGPQDQVISVAVTDTGIGMSQEVVARLFSSFMQADGATTRRFGGTGLGLVISRHLALLMGGDITVTSRQGQGSTFTLSFRARSVAQALPAKTQGAAAGPSVQGLRGMRILLTDDNAINRRVINFFLAPQGCAITEAANGREALDRLAAQPFDLVLLDVHMPVMDGVQTIQAIRRSEAPWRAIPVIALTADAMSGDREKYMALGMDDYISKPVDQRELLVKLHQLLNIETETVVKTGTGG